MESRRRAIRAAQNESGGVPLARRHGHRKRPIRRRSRRVSVPIRGPTKRTFRGTHVLVPLKRDELIGEDRGEELEELVKSTRELQKLILDRYPN